jgi:hypothetical protein
VLVVRVHEELLAAEQMPAVAGNHGIWARRYREIGAGTQLATSSRRADAQPNRSYRGGPVADHGV